MQAIKSDFPDYWAILYVLYFAPKHRIKGKVLLNKILAYCQARGMPIPWFFSKEQRGSQTWEVDKAIKDALEEKLIKTSEISVSSGLSPRVDIELGERGKEYVEKFLIPRLTKKESLKIRHDHISNKIPELAEMTSGMISKEEHKLLDLDDPEKFITKCSGNMKRSEEIYKNCKAIIFEDKEKELTVRGIARFCSRVSTELYNVLASSDDAKRWKMLGEMGIYYVAQITKELLDLLEHGMNKKKDYEQAVIWYEDLKKLTYHYKLLKPLTI